MIVVFFTASLDHDFIPSRTSVNTRLAAHFVRPNRFAASPVWGTLYEIPNPAFEKGEKYNIIELTEGEENEG